MRKVVPMNYYEEALKICKDDKVKEEINNILQG